MHSERMGLDGRVDAKDGATGGLSLGIAVSAVAGIFVVGLPAMVMLYSDFQRAHGVDGPRIADLLVALSPWGPLLIGVAAVIAIWIKEKHVSAPVATKLNVAAIVVTLAFGGLFLLVPWNAMLSVSRTLSY